MPEGFCRNSPLMRRHAPFSVALRLSDISVRLICALGLYLFCARGLGGMCGGLLVLCGGMLVLRARFTRSVLRFARLFQDVKQLDGAFCLCVGMLVLRTRFCAACAVCAAVCAVCALGLCALRVYFKVSNNSTARFVVTVSAPPLSGSASPALSTSSPKGSPPAVRSSFI